MFGGSPVTAVVAVRASYQVDVAQLIQPEVVDGRGEAREVIGLERGVAEGDGGAQPRQNPPVGDALLAAQLTTQVESVLVSLARCLFMEVYGCQVFKTGPFYSHPSALTWAFSTGTKFSPSDLMANLTAFHSLLQKWR